MNAVTTKPTAHQPAPDSSAPDSAASLTPSAFDTSSPRSYAHVDTWIFDLDNTLYSHESRVWPQVGERITLYVAEMFGIDGLSAQALQKYYYHRYGTTLRGLMEEQGIDPDDFLDFAHEVDLTLLDPNARLGAAIGALPGRKLILTNGSRRHAENICRKLGIDEHFEDVFDIAAAGFVPKPEQATYDLFLDKHAIDPARAAMFEDIGRNLLVPHAMGMTTALVLPSSHDPYREAFEQSPDAAPHIDFMTSDLADFLLKLDEG